MENAYSLTITSKEGLNRDDSDFRKLYALIYSKYIYALSLIILFLAFKFIQHYNEGANPGVVSIFCIGLLFAVLRVAPVELLAYFDKQRVVSTRDYRLQCSNIETDRNLKARLLSYLDEWISQMPTKDPGISTLANLMNKALYNSSLLDHNLLIEFQKVDRTLSSKSHTVNESIEILQNLYDKM